MRRSLGLAIRAGQQGQAYLYPFFIGTPAPHELTKNVLHILPTLRDTLHICYHFGPLRGGGGMWRAACSEAKQMLKMYLEREISGSNPVNTISLGRDY